VHARKNETTDHHVQAGYIDWPVVNQRVQDTLNTVYEKISTTVGPPTLNYTIVFWLLGPGNCRLEERLNRD
jgi:hypothetical protein